MIASVFIATSVDGFIARADGGLDWLPGPADGAEAEDYGYQAFIDSVDALVLGRRTYEFALSLVPWPYRDKPVVALSRGVLAIPRPIAGTVEWMSAAPAEIVRRLSERGFARLYVDGGETIRGFLAAGLVRELTVTAVPVLLGGGIPLFGPLPHDLRLRLVGSRVFADGLVQSRYEVIGPGGGAAASGSH